MKPQEMTIEQLDAELEALDSQRLKLKDNASVLMAVRNHKIAQDAAAEHGLTVDEYAAAKERATEEVPLKEILRQARRGRALQVAHAEPVEMRAKGSQAKT